MSLHPSGSPDHDPDDPQGFLNAIEVAWLAADSTTPLCHDCQASAKMLPMSGPGWGLEVFHQRHCPQHDDNLPAPVRPDDGELS